MMSAALAPGMAAIVLFGTFLALFVLRVPVAFALGLACLPSLVLEPRLSPMMLFNETFKAYNSFILLAVPFYLLTANLMNVGGVTSTSIGAMYLAGFLPGLLIAAAQMATVHVYAKIYHYPVYPRATLKEFFYSAWISIPALLTAFIIVGGVLLGWFTPTESACVAVLYTVVLSVFVYREMKLKNLYDSFVETGRLSSVALFCVGTASAFGWLLAYYQIPRALLDTVSTWGT